MISQYSVFQQPSIGLVYWSADVVVLADWSLEPGGRGCGVNTINRSIIITIPHNIIIYYDYISRLEIFRENHSRNVFANVHCTYQRRL